MRIKMALATEADAGAIAALRKAVARELTSRCGPGSWSFAVDAEEGVKVELGMGMTYIARQGVDVVATLRLTTRFPWLGENDFFKRCERPLYLMSMAVAPERQRQGLGQQCLEEARRIAVGLRAQALRLDTYDGPAGAAEFYKKAGFREVRRAAYHGTPLVWFEKTIGGETARGVARNVER